MEKDLLQSPKWCLWFFLILLTVHTAAPQCVHVVLGKLGVTTDGGEWKFPVTCVVPDKMTSGRVAYLQTPHGAKLKHTSSTGHNFTFLLDPPAAPSGLYSCVLRDQDQRDCDRHHLAHGKREETISAENEWHLQQIERVLAALRKQLAKEKKEADLTKQTENLLADRLTKMLAKEKADTARLQKMEREMAELRKQVERLNWGNFPPD